MSQPDVAHAAHAEQALDDDPADALRRLGGGRNRLERDRWKALGRLQGQRGDGRR